MHTGTAVAFILGDLRWYTAHGANATRSPRTVTYAVLASGLCCQARLLSSIGLQVLAVPQALPGLRHVKRRPAAVVRIVTLMRAPRK